MEKELLTCPWCGEQMRFDADSVHCWYKCDNCFSNSPKARRLWDNSKTNKENWDINKAKALFLIERSNAKSSRWISVEKRLPGDDCDWVLAIGKFVPENIYGKPIISELRKDGEWWGDINDEFPLEDMGIRITHWMPLPTMPKEE